MKVFPNVKVNLGLNVLRRREDGFHDIETLFVPYLGIRDSLEINPSDSFSIRIEKDGGVDWDPMKDLTVRAYGLLRDDFGLPPVSIVLEKHAPVGAGLGGGSSDAAFALKALDAMFSLGLSEQRLAAYAARLGSDCAFFVYNRPMLGSGRGEILEDFPLMDIDYGQGEGNYLLRVEVPEGVSVSTAQAYRGIVPAIPEHPLRDILGQPVGQWRGLLVNDFEKTVFAVHPSLAAMKEEMYRSGAVYASMSGSGSALYCLMKK